MDNNEKPSEPTVESGATRSSRPRRPRLRILLGTIALVLVLLGGALYWLLVGQYHESTADAFVGGNIVAVTARIGGVVTAIGADNTDFVTAGTTLVKLDEADTRLALTHAQAQLASIVRQVRTQYSDVGQARSNVVLRKVEWTRANADLAHRRRLTATGAISGEDIRHSQDAVRAAAAALAVAKEQLVGSLALTDRTSVASNPQVLMAAAQLRDAYVAAYRTTIPAPVSGMVTKRSVQVGQQISPGVALMSIVPLEQVWVDANFKESQLRNIRIGQPVRLTADVYGGGVVFDGTVVGQDAGTGSAFSLLPAQNATGNWIKVVQRVPVRIALKPRQVARHPLQLGLSTSVTVDTHHRAGHRLVARGAPRHRYQTNVFSDHLASAADADIRRIVQANR